MSLALIIAFFIGILSFLSPCIIPMIIVYLSSITGFSFEQLLESKDSFKIKRHLIISTLIFIASFTLVFTLAGGFAGFIGSFFTSYSRLMESIGGILFILFGLYLTGLFKFEFLKDNLISRLRGKIENKINIKKLRTKDGMLGYIGIFLIGFFFAVICSHCIGPTLYPTLIYAAATGSLKIGILTLFAFSVGLGIPFLLTALFLNSMLSYLKKIKKKIKIIMMITGIILILFGILMLTGNFMLLSDYFDKIIPWNLGLTM